MVRGYYDTPVGSAVIGLVIANVMVTAAEYLPDSTKVRKVKELSPALVTAAHLQLVESFDIDALIDSMFSGIVDLEDDDEDTTIVTKATRVKKPAAKPAVKKVQKKPAVPTTDPAE